MANMASGRSGRFSLGVQPLLNFTKLGSNVPMLKQSLSKCYSQHENSKILMKHKTLSWLLGLQSPPQTWSLINSTGKTKCLMRSDKRTQKVRCLSQIWSSLMPSLETWQLSMSNSKEFSQCMSLQESSKTWRCWAWIVLVQWQCLKLSDFGQRNCRCRG